MKNEGSTYAHEEKFREAYAKFKDTGLLQRLEEKYRDKPFFEEYKEENLTVEIGSYFINGLSVALAFYFIYQILSIFIPGALIPTTLSVVLLSIWEYGKRGFLKKALKKKIANKRLSASWFAVLFLVAGSMVYSFLGGKDLMEDYTYNPAFVNVDSLSASYSNDIAALEVQKSGLVSQKNEQGQTYYKLIDEIAALDMSISEIRKERINDVKLAKIQNLKEQAAVTVTSTLNGWWFGAAGALMDILLIMCIWFNEYYDNRSFGEIETLRRDLEKEEKTFIPTPVNNVSPLNDAVKEVLNAAPVNGNGVSLNGVNNVNNAGNIELERKTIGFKPVQSIVNEPVKKTAVKEMKPTLVTVKGLGYIDHNGKRLSKKDCQDRISIYKSKLKRKECTLKTYQKNVNYFMKGIRLIEQQEKGVKSL